MRIHYLSFLLLLVYFASAEAQSSSLQVGNIPILSSLGNIVNRITNRTIGAVRGGINVVSNTLHNIIYRVGEASQKVTDALNELRVLMRTGIPDLGIPTLEPLTIEEISLDLNHEAISISGVVQDIIVRQLSKFRIDRVNVSVSNGLVVSLQITFPYVEVNGNYDITGVIGDLFQIYGDGPFWLKAKGLTIATDLTLNYNSTGASLYVQDMDIDISLAGMENNFQNLMHDDELCEIFNKAISSLAPEAVNIIWPEIKSSVEEQVMRILNKILEDNTLNNIAGRLLNIINVN